MSGLAPQAHKIRQAQTFLLVSWYSCCSMTQAEKAMAWRYLLSHCDWHTALLLHIFASTSLTVFRL
jgi:hypothetical protein